MRLGLLSQVRSLARVMKTNVSMLAADGQYRQAFEQTLTLRRMGVHVGDENLISFLVSVAIDALAQKSIQSTLSVMPPDWETLLWLKGELAMTSRRQVLIQTALKTEEQNGPGHVRSGQSQPGRGSG